jgi:hypothetical protein
MIVGAFSMLINSQSNVNFSTSDSSTITMSGNQTLDNDTSQLSQEQTNAVFNIDMTTGLIALIIVLVVVGVVAGIRVLGSGLSSYSVMLIHKSTVYYGLWGVFSAFSFGLFLGIPIFGVLIWFALTLVYSIGFFSTLNSSESGD